MVGISISFYILGSSQKGKMKNRITIDERAEIINQRKCLGDFEIDLIVGLKNKSAKEIKAVL